MRFPIEVVSKVESHSGNFDRKLTIRSGVTTLLGPNGSGKTHLLRGLKVGLGQLLPGRIVRFISAGRIGPLEQFRSDYDGHRDIPLYDNVSFGSRKDGERRHRIETLQSGFQTLSKRPDILIKVQERLQKLFRRQLLIEWDGGNLKALFNRMDVGSQPYSAAREASGLLQLVGILATLYDDEVAAVLLDEPEVSLHPQLQSFLLSEVHRVAGDPDVPTKKLVVVATHSAEMIQIDTTNDLCTVAFCDDLKSDPLQLDPSIGELRNRKLTALVARLGQGHKSAFFSKRPLFVEGPSDVMICKAVAKKTEAHLEAAGSHILPVIGKGEMPALIKLFRLIGKSPVVMVDADGVVDDFDLINSFVSGCTEADKLAQERGGTTASDWSSRIYGDYCRMLDEFWIDVRGEVESHPYWTNREPGTDERKARRRAAFCQLVCKTDSELNDLPREHGWPAMRNRVEALLGLLEKLGCFILRRGTIECYYQQADRFTDTGKPNAAAEELEFIVEQGSDRIRDCYKDVVQCIEFAADCAKICEADGLRDLTLAIAAPCVSSLRLGLRTDDAITKARSLIDSRASIFGLSVEDGKLIMSLESKILDVKGFPIEFLADDDVVKVVTQNLK